MPLFTVVIPTYSRPKLLRLAVASIQAQTLDDFECIIVDDVGPIPAKAPDDPRFRVIRRESNGGQGASINTGILASKGEYLCFLDDDDLATPNRLQIALEGFERAPISVCWSVTFGGATPARRHVKRPPRSWDGDLRRSIREGPTPNVGQTSVRRDHAVLFDESFRASADVEWWIRLARRGTVATVPKVGLMYRVHDSARHGNPTSARVQSLVRIYELHRDYFDANPKATAYHFRRIGMCAMRSGADATGPKWLLRSLGVRPHPKTLWHLVRALRRMSWPGGLNGSS